MGAAAINAVPASVKIATASVWPGTAENSRGPARCYGIPMTTHWKTLSK